MTDAEFKAELARATAANLVLKRDRDRLHALLTEKEAGEKAKADAESLKVQLAKAKKQADDAIHFKIGQKGGISVYGLQKFPTTLYREQWTRVLSSGDRLAAFIVENDDAITKTVEQAKAAPRQHTLRRIR